MQPHKRDPKRRVVAAAATILDNHGIADLTMRRLARELDITPGALYWHFNSKQQLLGAVADRLLDRVCAGGRPIAEADWRRRVTVLCSGMRDALLSHTDGAELVSASFAAAQSRAVVEILAALSEAAATAGLGPEQAELAARTLVHYVLGATADEQSRLQWDAAGALPDQPMMSTDPSGSFGFGLRLLIDGLAAQSTRSAADRVLDTLVPVPPA